MSKYEISLDLSDYGILDEFALLARQDYNLGNQGKWFNAFRGGLYGFHSRLHGFATHYNTVHAWIPVPRIPSETEHHLASIFFCMDSAVECLTFAVNALGYASEPNLFRDITSERALRHISPKDVLGNPFISPPQEPLSGYKTLFPTFQSYWQSKRELLSIIIEQHDVSKHRETIFVGGMARLDPPPGFYESLGIKDNATAESHFWPMAEIILQKDPKSVRMGRTPQTTSDSILLEDVANDFYDFLRGSSQKLIQDAKTYIKLNYDKFLENKENP